MILDDKPFLTQSFQATKYEARERPPILIYVVLPIPCSLIQKTRPLPPSNITSRSHCPSCQQPTPARHKQYSTSAISCTLTPSTSGRQPAPAGAPGNRDWAAWQSTRRKHAPKSLHAGSCAAEPETVMLSPEDTVMYPGCGGRLGRMR